MFPYRSPKPKGVLEFYHKCIDEYKDEMKKNLDFIAKCCANRDVVYAWGTNTISKSRKFCGEYDYWTHHIINTVKDIAIKEFKENQSPMSDTKETITPLHGLRWRHSSSLVEYDSNSILSFVNDLL